MAVYYSETTCLVTKWRSKPPLVPLMAQWAFSWGTQAVPYIRAVVIVDRLLPPDGDSIRLGLSNPSTPVEYSRETVLGC
jgi:hypothetical protein